MQTAGNPIGVFVLDDHILELIGEGLTNRHIGERLFLSEKTIKNYVATLFGKLGLEQRTQAAAYAARAVDGHTSGPGRNIKITGRKPRQCLVIRRSVRRVQPVRVHPFARSGLLGCRPGTPRCGTVYSVRETVVRDCGGNRPYPVVRDCLRDFQRRAGDLGLCWRCLRAG